MTEQNRAPLSESCIHHWVIGNNNIGICKKCGAHRHFCNSWEQAISHRVWTRKAAKGPEGPAQE